MQKRITFKEYCKIYTNMKKQLQINEVLIDNDDQTDIKVNFKCSPKSIDGEDIAMNNKNIGFSDLQLKQLSAIVNNAIDERVPTIVRNIIHEEVPPMIDNAINKAIEEKINPRLDRIEHRLDNLEKRVDNIEKDIKAIKSCPTIQRELNL